MHEAHCVNATAITKRATYSRVGEPRTIHFNVTLSPSLTVMYSVVADGPFIRDGGN